ncbi:MAG: hypothetical protein II547_05320 [Treponema sp.]|nr:hypothetical protein [Treponema sp.]
MKTGTRHKKPKNPNPSANRKLGWAKKNRRDEKTVKSKLIRTATAFS